MAGDLIGLGICFFYIKDNQSAQTLCIIFILLFVILFEFSLGPIPWVYMAEIMTDKGLSIAILLNWLFTLLIAIVTPFVISGELFIVFGAMCAVCACFCLFIMKETKGLTEAEVACLYATGPDKYNVIEKSN